MYPLFLFTKKIFLYPYIIYNMDIKNFAFRWILVQLLNARCKFQYGNFEPEVNNHITF